MKPIVLFGAGKIAEVLLHFFRECSDREVVACTVDRDYLPGSRWHDLPAVAFEEVSNLYPPETHDMFVALGYQDMNSVRAFKCTQATSMGYSLVSYIHPNSGVPSDLKYGNNCFIMNDVHIHPQVNLGNNVFVWSGAMIGHHSSIGDNCWITSNAGISGVVNVESNCFFAINSTVGHGVQIGRNCFIGANALITKSTKENEVYIIENTKSFRMNSQQFMRFSKFSDL